MKEHIINAVAFLLPAIIAFITFHYSDTLVRIGYAIPFGLVFSIVAGAIQKGAKEEFRTNERVSVKVSHLIAIIALPVVFFLAIGKYREMGQMYGLDRLASVWASFLITSLVVAVIYYAIRYVIRMFEKE